MDYSDLNKKSWDAISHKYQEDCGGLRKISCLNFGPLLDEKKSFGLIGKIKGLMILEIGCGAERIQFFLLRKAQRRFLPLILVKNNCLLEEN